MNKKYHWFCFSYSGKEIKSGQACQASICVRRKNRNITLNDINELKEPSSVKIDAVLIAVSYLGYMTKEEFGGDSE